MQELSYVAYDSKDRRVQGTIAGANRMAVAEKLSAMGFKPAMICSDPKQADKLGWLHHVPFLSTLPILQFSRTPRVIFLRSRQAPNHLVARLLVIFMLWLFYFLAYGPIKDDRFQISIFALLVGGAGLLFWMALRRARIDASAGTLTLHDGVPLGEMFQGKCDIPLNEFTAVVLGREPSYPRRAFWHKYLGTVHLVGPQEFQLVFAYHSNQENALRVATDAAERIAILVGLPIVEETDFHEHCFRPGASADQSLMHSGPGPRLNIEIDDCTSDPIRGSVQIQVNTLAIRPEAVIVHLWKSTTVSRGRHPRQIGLQHELVEGVQVPLTAQMEPGEDHKIPFEFERHTDLDEKNHSVDWSITARLIVRSASTPAVNRMLWEQKGR